MSDSGFSGPTKLVIGLLLIAFGLAFALWYATSDEAPKLGDAASEPSLGITEETPAAPAAPGAPAPAGNDRPTSVIGVARESAAKAQQKANETYQKALEAAKPPEPPN